MALANGKASNFKGVGIKTMVLVAHRYTSASFFSLILTRHWHTFPPENNVYDMRGLHFKEYMIRYKGLGHGVESILRSQGSR